MSAEQTIASSRFLTAMGPMTDGAPCNFTEQEIIGFADKAEQEYAAGAGMMDHSEFMQEVATWQR